MAPWVLARRRLREICEKHYNQLLPIMAEKVHQEKLQGVQTRLTYGESSCQKAQTQEKTQLSELESCDRKRRTKKRRNPSPYTISRGTRPDQSPSVFSRLRHEDSNSTHQRSAVNTTMFTRRRVSSGRSAKDPNHRRKEARKLVRSYGTCSSERQRAIEREWDANDRENKRQPTRTEKLTSLRASMNEADIGSVPRKFLTTKKYIKDPVKIHHIKQQEGETTKAFMERFKAESMHINGALKCMRVFGFMHDITNPDLIKRLNDNNLYLPHKLSFDKRPNFKNRHKSSRRHDRFTPLVKTPKEIIAMDMVKFKAPPPMSGLAENRNKNKFCEFHGDKGYNTNECIHLKKQIEKAVRYGQLSHLIKELKQGSNKGEHSKASKKGET
ncbi:hypothetical protein Tco_1106167 [Tanacetum coccineum]